MTLPAASTQTTQTRTFATTTPTTSTTGISQTSRERLCLKHLTSIRLRWRKRLSTRSTTYLMHTLQLSSKESQFKTLSPITRTYRWETCKRSNWWTCLRVTLEDLHTHACLASPCAKCNSKLTSCLNANPTHHLLSYGYTVVTTIKSQTWCTGSTAPTLKWTTSSMPHKSSSSSNTTKSALTRRMRVRPASERI